MGRSDRALAVICIWDHFFEMFKKAPASSHKLYYNVHTGRVRGAGITLPGYIR